MEREEIRALAQIMRDMGLESMEIGEGDSYVRMRMARPAASVPLVPLAAQAPAAERAPEAVPAQAPEENLVTVSAPMVGVFYVAPSPEERPFVSPGDQVKAGDVIGIIEAMKMMNEITTEVSGEVVELCASNSQVVDYGHPLVRIRPAAQ